MVLFVALTHALEDLHGLLDARLLDLNGLQAPLQRGVALDVLAVVVQRGSADALHSPRASDGLRMLAASTAPSAAPAPTSMCISSMNSMQLPELLISSMTFFRRSSNSPLYLVPATSAPMSRVSRRLPAASPDVAGDDALGQALDDGGLADAWSPIRIGLFLVRRERIWISRSISRLRPMTGSSLPARDAAVRSIPSWSTVGVRVLVRPLALALCGVLWERMRAVSARTLSRLTPRDSSTPKQCPRPHA